MTIEQTAHRGDAERDAEREEERLECLDGALDAAIALISKTTAATSLVMTMAGEAPGEDLPRFKQALGVMGAHVRTISANLALIDIFTTEEEGK